VIKVDDLYSTDFNFKLASGKTGDVWYDGGSNRWGKPRKKMEKTSVS